MLLNICGLRVGLYVVYKLSCNLHSAHCMEHQTPPSKLYPPIPSCLTPVLVTDILLLICCPGHGCFLLRFPPLDILSLRQQTLVCLVITPQDLSALHQMEPIHCLHSRACQRQSTLPSEDASGLWHPLSSGWSKGHGSLVLLTWPLL